MAAEDWVPDDYGCEEEEDGVECRFCGKGDLEWEDDNGQWVLLERNRKIHKCNPARKARNLSSDFDDLS